MNLEPHSLGDILDNVVAVGKAIGAQAAAHAVRDSLLRRIDTVRQKTASLSQRPRVFCMEWVNPPFCGGHWMKELVEIAGGCDDLAVLYRPSRRIEWKKVREFSPQVLVLTCCGFGLSRCAKEGEILVNMEGARDLPAIRTGRVYATDGSAYFSRPGPRIVESLEILAHLIHPGTFPAPPLTAAFTALNLPAGERV